MIPKNTRTWQKLFRRKSSLKGEAIVVAFSSLFIPFKANLLKKKEGNYSKTQDQNEKNETSLKLFLGFDPLAKRLYCLEDSFSLNTLRSLNYSPSYVVLPSIWLNWWFFSSDESTGFAG